VKGIKSTRKYSIILSTIAVNTQRTKPLYVLFFQKSFSFIGVFQRLKQIMFFATIGAQLAKKVGKKK